MHVVTFVNICTVFLISGLTLRTDELKQALTRQTLLGTVYGFIAILGGYPIPCEQSIISTFQQRRMCIKKTLGEGNLGW